jgi:outer membrane protein OmpA-like peptidoglycan-associated protein
MLRLLVNILSTLAFCAALLILFAALAPSRPTSQGQPAFRAQVQPPRAPQPVPAQSTEPPSGPAAGAALTPEAEPPPPDEITANAAKHIPTEQIAPPQEPSPAGQSVPAAGEIAQPALPRLLLRLSGDCFTAHQDALLPQCAAQVADIASAMKESPSMKIRIEGHCDTVPLGERARISFQDNLGLSMFRAKVVNDILVKDGVEQARMTVSGFGDSRPLVIGGSEAQQTANRRIEIWLTD